MSFGHERLDAYRAARIVAMLTRLGRHGYVIRDASTGYAVEGIDTDGDTDTDPEGAGRAEHMPNTYQASLTRRA